MTGFLGRASSPQQEGPLQPMVSSSIFSFFTTHNMRRIPIITIEEIQKAAYIIKILLIPKPLQIIAKNLLI